MGGAAKPAVPKLRLLVKTSSDKDVVEAAKQALFHD